VFDNAFFNRQGITHASHSHKSTGGSPESAIIMEKL